MRRSVIALTVLTVWACKKHEAVQQAAPTETTAASAPPSVSVVPETIASIAPSESASAAPSSSAPVDKEAARREALREAAEFGMIGLVPIDAGEYGPGGSGTGIGLGNIGTIGGRGTPRDAGPMPQIRQGAVQVNGRLPPEVIQRIARQNWGRFRLCYQNGLRSNPSLQGRVAVKYIIDRDGSVKGTPTDGGSDLPDQGVVQCVIRAFQNLSYPQPEGGIVTVVYPLIFSPGS